MNGDLKTYCSALVRRFVGMQYDGLTGMAIKPGLIATDKGSKALRRSIDKMRAVNIKKKRNLRNADFQILKINVPPVPDSPILVTAVESYRLEYDSNAGEGSLVTGRRGHTFQLTLGSEGSWVVDNYSYEVLDERNENAGIMQRAAQTVLMQRQSGAHEPVPDAYQSPARSQSLARLRWKTRFKKLGAILLFMSWVSCVYVWMYGAHSRIDRLCLYCGQHRDTLTVMGKQIWDRHRETDVSKWVNSLGLPAPPDAPDGHFYVLFGGWDKKQGEDRAVIQPDNESLLVFDASQTLQVIYLKSQEDGAEAVSAYGRYRALIDQVIKIHNGDNTATNLEAIKDSMRKMRVRLSGLE